MSHFPSRTRNMVGCLSAAILTLAVGHFLPATEPPADREKTDPAEKTRAVIDEVLARHQVFPDAESKEPLKAVPALRWSNNTRGTNNALTVLYVRNGRPYAAACLFPYDRGMIHDFQSLARGEDKIVVRGGGKTVWEPRKPGVEYAPIPNAPAPKGTRAERLLQIKQLAGGSSPPCSGGGSRPTTRRNSGSSPSRSTATTRPAGRSSTGRCSPSCKGPTRNRCY